MNITTQWNLDKTALNYLRFVAVRILIIQVINGQTPVVGPPELWFNNSLLKMILIVDRLIEDRSTVVDFKDTRRNDSK